MANSKIVTKRIFKRIGIELLKDKVKVVKSSPFESIEFEISYEHIEAKKTIETKLGFGWLVLVLLFVIMSILFFLHGDDAPSATLISLALLSFIISLATRLQLISIKSYDGSNLELYFNKRNKENVLDFSDKIINAANEYILIKYSKIDRDLPIDNQLERLDHLRNKDLITDEKFEQLKNQLLGRENKQSIGYR